MALLVTAGSLVMFPNSFIYFDVLHGIAVMLILVRFTAAWGAWLWPLGALAIAARYAAPLVIAAVPILEVLNTPALNWLGLVSRLPITEDFVPLIPWLGVMWWGVAAGRWVLAHRPQWLGSGSAPTGGLKRAGVLMGRRSLSYYLQHQPVLLGLIGGALWLWALN